MIVFCIFKKSFCKSCNDLPVGFESVLFSSIVKEPLNSKPVNPSLDKVKNLYKIIMANPVTIPYILLFINTKNTDIINIKFPKSVLNKDTNNSGMK